MSFDENPHPIIAGFQRIAIPGIILLLLLLVLPFVIMAFFDEEGDYRGTRNNPILLKVWKSIAE